MKQKLLDICFNLFVVPLLAVFLIGVMFVAAYCRFRGERLEPL